ncbi:MAG TPA: tripartite tricarboxylate transporter substrate-binding protein, partial [Burkholderiales bacterium]
MKNALAFATAVTAVVAAAGNAAAQTYPSRPVTLIVGFAPGGGTDTVARVMQKKVGEYLGQTVVVENRAGAGGTIAAAVVAKAEPDGYTILLATIAALAVAPHLNSKLPYNPLKDFAPISMATESGNVLVVHPSVPAKTLAEFVKLANSKPGGIAYGTSGVG